MRQAGKGQGPAQGPGGTVGSMGHTGDNLFNIVTGGSKATGPEAGRLREVGVPVLPTGASPGQHGCLSQPGQQPWERWSQPAVQAMVLEEPVPTTAPCPVPCIPLACDFSSGGSRDAPRHSGTAPSVVLPPSWRMGWLWHNATFWHSQWGDLAKPG